MLNRDLRTSPCNPSKPSRLGFRDLASPLAMWLCGKTEGVNGVNRLATKGEKYY